MCQKRAIIWFREDLRLHDNEALAEARKHANEIIPVFVFDERVFQGKTEWFDFPKTGKYRAKFIIESVIELRESLRKLGSDLYVRVGKPEEEIFDIAQASKTSWVFCNRERTRDEIQVQDSLERKLWSIGQEVRFSRGKMLFYTADLPFPVTQTPDSFTQFRKEVERFIPIRNPIPAPTEKFPPLTVPLASGTMPQLEDFGWEPFTADERGVLPFTGGESEGLRRLQYYLWETDLAANYKETRNGLLYGDYSTKFSPWLAHGCLSPKKIFAELKRYEKERVKNKSTYWIFFELMWRDFFRLMGKKHEEHIFLKSGTARRSRPELKNDPKLLQIWIEGKTGVPFIDANMRELAATGFMSNRGRQNVASFLINDLNVNWQMGAEYFESVLIDYDPMSNWGNWNYLAGVGSDPRENRYFNILSQAKRYDPKGDYVRHWIPELAHIPGEKIHQPERYSLEDDSSIAVQLGADYPKAMVDMGRWE